MQSQTELAKAASERLLLDSMTGRGPAHSVIQALSRIGWSAVDAINWTTDQEVAINLREVCSKTVSLLVDRAVVRQEWRWLSESREWVDFGRGGFISGLRFYFSLTAASSTRDSAPSSSGQQLRGFGLRLGCWTKVTLLKLPEVVWRSAEARAPSGTLLGAATPHNSQGAS